MEELQRVDPYFDWQAKEGIPVVTGLCVEDLNAVELGPWARMGAQGAFVNLGTKRGHETAAYLCEIPPGGSLLPQRHMFEEFIYVVSGRGATTVWNEGQPKEMIEWQEGSLFAIPLNAWHQHFNGGDRPARFFSHNNAPLIMGIFHSEKFLFENPFVFDDRFAGEGGYFSGEGTLRSVPGKAFRVWQTNFVPDARGLQLYEWSQRGARGLNVMLDMADAALHSHISQFPVGTYKKAHVDPRTRGTDPGGGSFLLVLDGVGFSLVWGPGDKELQRIDWKRNSLFISPAGWYHQHLNTGPTPARYLAATAGRGNRYSTTESLSDVSEREGGGQIEYEDENPEIHRIFEAELARNGAVCRMGGLSPHCTVRA